MIRKMGVLAAVVACVAVAVLPRPVPAAEPAKGGDKYAERRAELDTLAEKTLADVLAKSENAKALHDKAYGYAVFENLKFALGLSGGGGAGVAVPRSGQRTYMRMGTAGIGFGLGGQKYRVLFLFETEQAFRSFVDKGWQGDAAVQAAAGNKGANAGAAFNNGVAYYQITEKGLMASADVSGTKYWKYDKLNQE